MTTRFQLARKPNREWLATAIPGSPIGEQPYDLNPAAVREKPLLEARFLPEGMASENEVLAMAKAGRLSEAVFPSIQLAGHAAFVNFSRFVRHGRPAFPDAMTYCRESDGFRLLTAAKPGQTQKDACSQPGLTALQFRGNTEEAVVCEGCKQLGLPVRWRRVGPAPPKGCASAELANGNWQIESARREYADWLGRWKLESPRWLASKASGKRTEPGKIDDLAQSVVLSSRAIGTLAMISLEPQRLSGLLEGALEPGDWENIGERLTAMLENAVPVGTGGVYPELDKRYAKLCAEVWYVQIPALDEAMASGAKVPGFAAYGLPQAGTFRRSAYPFLTFTHTPQGIHLAGISREFLQVLLWQAFGATEK